MKRIPRKKIVHMFFEGYSIQKVADHFRLSEYDVEEAIRVWSRKNIGWA